MISNNLFDNKINFIMKASIFFFHGANNKYEEMTGYKHKQEIEVDQIFNTAAFIFGMGLNVMLYHASPTEMILMIDDKRFQQR